MKSRLFVAWFEREDAILEAARAARQAGYSIEDAYTPYAVHGMDEAMGLGPSRLPQVCLGCGLAGLLLAFGFQLWTSASDWPLNVGGKPLASVPAFMPLTFELMVLFAGLGTVAALFLRARLYPCRSPRFLLPRVTDDRFALVLAGADGRFDETEMRTLCERASAVATEVVEASS